MATHIILDDDVLADIYAARAGCVHTLSKDEIGQAIQHVSLPVQQIAGAAGISLREATLRYIAILSFGLEQGAYGD